MLLDQERHQQSRSRASQPHPNVIHLRSNFARRPLATGVGHPRLSRRIFAEAVNRIVPLVMF